MKHTEETKKKISEIRIKYLQQNPDKVPYRLYHSSMWSYPERIFKESLIASQIGGWKYNFDFGIYRLDFAFPELGIDIEIDGPTHLLKNVKTKDDRRDQYLKENGWRVIRFTSTEIMKESERCLTDLCLILNVHPKLIIPFISRREQKRLEKESKPRKRRKILTENQRKEYKNSVLEKRKLLTKEKRKRKINELIDNILNSNVDFSKFGWVKAVSLIIDIEPQAVNRWMKRNMNNFYQVNCFKRNTRV